MNRVILIPVLNEEHNINVLIARIEEVLIDTPYAATECIFIDGGSSDNTVSFIQSRSTQSQLSISLIHQKRRGGLGAGYWDGFEEALNRDAELIITMDGDLQHRPEDIPRFFKKADEGYDYVLGSRFTQNGSIPEDWGFIRKILSVGGNIIARILLRQSLIRDITSGYALFRVDPYIKTFDFNRLYSLRHAYKVHLLAYMLSEGALAIEIPIVFESRKSGESKLITNDIPNTLKVLFKICLQGP